MTDTLKSPERIYLIPDGEGGFMWCADPAPGTDMEPEDAIAYVRAALTPPAAVEDGELRRLMAEATPGPWKIERGKRCIQGPDEQGDPVIITIATGGSKQCSSPPYGEYCVPGMKEGDANAALIVAAVNALPGLMAERDRMREALYQVIDLDHHNMGPESSATKLARAALGEQP